ncbi:MAG: rhodanese-like domain-containing protein [Deltaproteobacteria bacterium]|nr:rhodanese-like domain-containing protein [Deltaproteobacteria bacterium]
MSSMTCGELAELMASSSLYAVFDVRERGEYNARQIANATSLPRSQIELRIEELVPNRNIPLVVYDEGGTRAQLAARLLTDLGYADVSVLDGGIAAWEREGRPTASGVNVPSKAFGEKVQQEHAVPDISPRELKQLLDANTEILILDVRTPEEYGRFCIPGGLNVPGGDLVLWAEALRQKPETKVIVNCAGRTRSIIGTAALRRLGLTNVLELSNGTMGWLLAGYDLETNPNRKGPRAPENSQARALGLAMKLAEEEMIAWTSAESILEISTGKGGGVTYIIDVRSESEFESGRIAGSINVPGGQAVQRTDDFIAVKNAKVIFVSHRSARAVMAAYWYKKMGFRDVSVLQGGIQSWFESGRTLVRGPEQKYPLGYERAKSAVRLRKTAEIQRVLPDSSVTILDVGVSLDYQAAHLPGAKWISRVWLELRLPRELPDEGSPILVTCHDGVQSVFAARTLAERGYFNVSVLEGGVEAWQAAGFETEKGLTVCWSEPIDVVLSPSITGDKEAMQRYLDWEVKLTR